MLIISHRGNLNGPASCKENRSTSIDMAIKYGYDVEIDLFYKENELYLGHDEPLEKVSSEWLNNRGVHLWIHCKNFSCLETLNKHHTSLNFFWHCNDSYTITKKGTIWCLAGEDLIYNSIAVLPERKIGVNYQEFNPENILIQGICTDHPHEFAKILTTQEQRIKLVRSEE